MFVQRFKSYCIFLHFHLFAVRHCTCRCSPRGGLLSFSLPPVSEQFQVVCTPGQRYVYNCEVATVVKVVNSIPHE